MGDCGRLLFIRSDNCLRHRQSAAHPELDKVIEYGGLVLDKLPNSAHSEIVFKFENSSVSLLIFSHTDLLIGIEND